MVKKGELTTTETSANRLLKATESHVLKLYNLKHQPALVYHNYQRVRRIFQFAQELISKHSLNPTIAEAIYISALFVETGYLIDYESPMLASIEEAERFFKQVSGSELLKREVMSTLRFMEQSVPPMSPAQQLLSDAVNAATYGTHFLEDLPVFQLEQELILGQKPSPRDFQQLQVQRLLKVKFYSPHAKLTYEPLIAQHLMNLKEDLEARPEEQNDEEHIPRLFQGIEKKIPGRAIQTYFRTNYRNHIHLSAIADTKANIMISVNAILISVLISVLTYKNITETTPMVLLPVLLFLITGLTSLIFAVLSIRPKITSNIDEHMPLHEIQKNLIFFGNFVQLELDRYEEAMDALFRNGELLYGNMTRDLYFLGKVLDKKYRYLTISYNIFMIGFVATVFTFLIALFT